MDKKHKILPFRVQRAIAAFAIALLLITFSVAVIWNHVDGIEGFTPGYRLLAKGGLAVVELTSLIFLAWELWTRDKTLSMACFVAEFVLVVVMLVHAGAVLTLDSSASHQTKTLNTVADAQAKIAAAREGARITAAAQQAAELNRQGQRQTARRLVAGATKADGAADTNLLENVLGQTKPTTFLPDSYMSGGLYYWPPLIAFVLFMIVLLISKTAIAYEDANGNGIPDHLEAGWPMPSVASKQIGFAPSGDASPKGHALTGRQG
jgi:hypothetical protein